MIRLAITMAISIMALLTGFANPPKQVRVDFTSKPEGAGISIDGKPYGLTPLTLFDLAPGRHRAQFTLAGYETADAFFTLGDGAYDVCHQELVPLKGLLLVTTDPAGVDVSRDGISFGETPRLITTLDVNQPHRLYLQKAGYQPRYIDVKFNARTPLVRNEKLILDSGTVSIITKPKGASVLVNGLRRGVTPLVLTDVPKGRATIKLSLEGYYPEERTITLNAGDSQEMNVDMEPKPGSLFLMSTPEGARFYIDDQIRGKGPLSLEQIRPGTYKVRAELEGYGSLEREVTVPLGGSASEEFRLESVRGALEIKTSPPGAQIIIDGHLYGTTVAGSSDEVSNLFTVKNLSVGDHAVVIRKEGFAEVVIHPQIKNNTTVQKMIRMRAVFKPNVEVVTASGTHRGVFVDNTPEAITIEVSRGITRSFLREDVRDVRFLTNQK